MTVKFADDIVKEIQERGNIEVPEGYVTGEPYEEWLHNERFFIQSEEHTEEDLIDNSSYKQ